MTSRSDRDGLCTIGNEELLLLQDDGALTGTRRERFLAHLTDCPRCQNEHIELSAFENRLRHVLAPIPPTEELDEKLIRRFHRAVASLETNIPGKPNLNSPSGFRFLAPLLSAAAIVLCAILILPGLRDEPLEWEVSVYSATRSADGSSLRNGEPFHIGLRIEEPRHLYMFNLDANHQLDLYFPYHDEQTGEWSHLGHEEGPLPAGERVLIPAPRFGSFQADAPSGSTEYFLTCLSKPTVNPTTLTQLLSDLRTHANGLRAAGESRATIAGSLADQLEQTFPDVRVVAYRID